MGFPPRRLLIGAAGRLSAEKGFDVLIRAVDQLLTAGYELALGIVGEGEQKARLLALIDELGRAERIRLLGYRPDLIEFYEAIDVYALSSLREGLPNVLREALGLEVPVVATRLPGIRRLLRDGENGLLVAPGSPEGLARGLSRLLDEDGLRARFAQAGRQTVLPCYSF